VFTFSPPKFLQNHTIFKEKTHRNGEKGCMKQCLSPSFFDLFAFAVKILQIAARVSMVLEISR
jgi:hypothetical protein